MNVNLTNAISLHPLPLIHGVHQQHQHSSSSASTARDRDAADAHNSRAGTPSSRRPTSSQHSRDGPSPPYSPPASRNDVSKSGATTSYEAVDVSSPGDAAYTATATRRHHTDPHANDIELQPPYTKASDPFGLALKVKSTDEIVSIKSGITRRGSSGGPIRSGRIAWHARKVGNFYESQNENIERLLKPVEEHRAEARSENEASAFKAKIAIHASFVANVCLAILQVYGAVSSSSLSLFTTMADALFDPMSNITLIASRRAINRVDPRRFPSGKARIETAGNIVFCFLMTSVSLILIVLSIKELAETSHPQTEGFHIPSIVAVGVAFVTKFALFCFCYVLKDQYSQIRILWEDHRNDLIINGFGLLTSVGGSKLRWWIDPAGAIVLSCLIAFLWLSTAYSEFQLLIGVTADPQMLQLITYISMTHSEEIRALDTVRAYHSGPRLIVEVDIVMEPEETLRATHDVAEELQMKLESLPGVERAYVHVDFETSHAPEHFLKKEI